MSNFSITSARDYATYFRTIKRLIDDGRLSSSFDDWFRSFGDHVLVVDLIERGTILPSFFNSWDKILKGGNSVAHLAIDYDVLPIDFNDWFIYNHSNVSVILYYITKYRALPLNYTEFDDVDMFGNCVFHYLFYYNIPLGFYPDENWEYWGVSNREKNSVAHIAASKGLLPNFGDDWFGWNMTNTGGSTVRSFYDNSAPLFSSTDKAKSTLQFNNALEAAQNRKLLGDAYEWTLVNLDGYSVAHTHVKNQGRLPRYFKHWGLIDASGRSVAHLYLDRDKLPGYFQDWHITDQTGESVAHVAARKNFLPDRFTNWGMPDDKGNTVAHVAARAGYLQGFAKDWAHWGLEDADGITVLELKYPEANVSEWRNFYEKLKNVPAARSSLGSFDDAYATARRGDLEGSSLSWSLRNNLGETVAHVIVKKDGIGLPHDFDNWELRDRVGVTVAHYAASNGRLPYSFNRWGISSHKTGNTIAHEVVLSNGPLPINFKDWGLTNRKGNTVAHYAAYNGLLPFHRSKSSIWAYENNNGDTVAHYAAAGGHLPDFGSDWEMLDKVNDFGDSVRDFLHQNVKVDLD